MDVRTEIILTIAMRELGYVFLFFLVVAVIFTAPVSLRPHELAVDDGDPIHISWILAWVAHQAVRDPAHLFDSNTFYPYENSLAFSEHLIAPALLAAPVFYISGNALLAQNVTVVLTLALSAWAMFLLMREILGRSDAAVLAGMVYAFHTYNFHEMPRLQLLSIQWWPLAALYLHRSFVDRSKRNAVLFALFFLLQGLSCTYYLFYFTLVLALWIPAYVLVTREWRGLRNLVPPLLVVGAAFALIAIPYWRMLRQFDFERSLAEGLDLLEYLRPPAGGLLAQFYGFDFEPSVVPQFLGIFPPLLALIGLVFARPEGRTSRLFLWLTATTLVVGVILSLGPVVRVGGEEWGAGPYAWLYRHLPFFRVLRNAERISLLVHFGLAALAGFGAKVLFTRTPQGLLSVARVGLLVLLPYEHFSGGQAFAEIPAGARAPEVYRWLASTGDDEAVIELPVYPRAQLTRHALYMFQSTNHWKPVVFGRTSFYPPLIGYLAWELRGFPDRPSLSLLEGLGVQRIVVHPKVWPAEERREKLAQLRSFAGRLVPEGHFGPLEGRLYDRYGLGDERVYRLARAGSVPPVEGLCEPSGEVEPDGWRLSGESSQTLRFATDRDPSTKWRSEKQIPSLKLEVDLGREKTVAAIEIGLSYPFDEFPRDLGLKVRREDGRFERVVYRDDVATKWEVVEALVSDPSRAAITLRFDPVRARRLRFWIREGESFDYALPPWTLSELRIYRSCEP